MLQNESTDYIIRPCCWGCILKIKVNKENCIGCGLCVNICPEVFAMDENGKSEVLEGDIEKFNNAINDSIESCPVNAIEEV